MSGISQQLGAGCARGLDPASWPVAMVVALCLALGGPPARALDNLPRSFSRSEQFVVYARSGGLRGAVCSLAEDVKSGMLSVLGMKDDWKLPIILALREPQPNAPDATPPVRFTLGQTGSGLKIEVDFIIGEASAGTSIRDELVRAMLVEIAYRNSTSLPAGRDYTPPPLWLVQGLSAYLENQEDAISASLFAALLPTTETLSATDFLSRDPATMDSPSRAVYRAYAYNLVCVLLQELKDGRAGLLSFVRGLPRMTADDARSADALARNFPELNATPDSLAKWWTLGLAHLAETDRFQLFTVEETEQRLQALTAVTIPADRKRGRPAHTCTLMDFRQFPKGSHGRRYLEGNRLGLAALSGQANPLSRQIVLGYEEVVAALAHGKNGGIAEKLQALADQRRDVLKYRDQIADYMNWFEATQPTTQSGAFETYFHLARQMDGREPTHRPDPISVYLDGLGTEF